MPRNGETWPLATQDCSPGADFPAPPGGVSVSALLLFLCALGYQALAQRITCGVRSIVSSELCLCLFYVAADRLFTKAQRFSDFGGLLAHRHHAQDSKLARG